MPDEVDRALAPLLSGAMPELMLQRSTLPPPPALKSIARASLFIDFDGTLVEIAAQPDAIEPPSSLGSRLERLAERLDGRLAVVTGRSLANLAEFLGECSTFSAGSHGAHVTGPSGEILREAESLPAGAVARLEHFAEREGLDYEAKTHGGALHYRGSPDREKQVLSVADEIGRAHGLEVKRGKFVAELVQPGADKGGAVRILMEQADFGGSVPIFIGDDVTDEDGMAVARELGGFGIAVGERESHHASYHLPSVKDVYRWLDL